MKTILLGGMALAAVLAGPAMAADMPVKAAPPPVLYDWTGAYVGFNVGGMWHEVDRTFPNTGGGFLTGGGRGNHTTEDSDGIIGVHGGAQWQFGMFVFGVEAALSGCWLECRAVSGRLPVPTFTANTFSEHKITNLVTVGPRFGIAWDRFLGFVTGGAASATLNGSYCSTLTNLCGPTFTNQNGQTSWTWGWYAGAGFEYMVYKGPLVDAIVGLEYQYWEVDSERAFCANPGCVVPSGLDYNLGANGSLVRARFTIKTQAWGWWGTP